MKFSYKSLFFFGLLALLMARVGFAETAAVTAYEIKDFRFGRYAKQGYERLVLELVEKEKTLAPAPSVKVNPNSAHSDVMVNISPAVLTGAIPESLINEAFTKKSKLLGSLSVNTDNSAGTVSLKASLKDPKAAVEAFWLNNPPRIVVDAISAGGKKGRGVATHEDSGSSTGTSEAPAKKWRAGDFICFPSGAQAKLSVVFKARAGGSDFSPIPVPMPSAPAPQEAIVCYPRNTQVTAALSFAMPEEEGGSALHSSNHYGGAEHENTPVPQVKAPAPTPVPTPSASNNTGASRGVSNNNESKKSANSISLLPPLR